VAATEPAAHRGTRKLKAPRLASGVPGRDRRGRAPATRSKRWSRASRGGRQVAAGTTLEELGLSSLERVELMVALEDSLPDVQFDEPLFASGSIGDLKTLVAAAPRLTDGRTRGLSRRGTGRWPVWLVRRLSQARGSCRSPACSRFRVPGREHLRELTGRWCSPQITRATSTCR
jgi:hypothetical protein